MPLLEQRDTLDIAVNADESLWVNRLGRGWEQPGSFSLFSDEASLVGNRYRPPDPL